MKHSSKVKKIAIDAHSLSISGWAGKEHYTSNLISSLAQFDAVNSYTIYTNKHLDIVLPKNFIIKAISLPSIFWHIFTAMHVSLSKIDIFIAPTSFIIPTLLPQKTSSFVVVHDLVAFLPIGKNHKKKAIIIEKVFFKLALKKAKKIIAISENTKKDITRILKINKDINVIYQSCSPRFSRKSEKIDSIAQEKFNLPHKYLLFVGTIEPRKNLKLLINSFRQLQNENDLNDYKLVIVGKKGWNSDDVFKLIIEQGLEGKIEFTGYVEDRYLPSIFRLASCFVFPTKYEGFGIPILEAMSSGTPVITSMSSSTREVAGSAAFYFNLNKDNDLAKAIRVVLLDIKLRNGLIAKGQSQAQSFSPKKVAEEFINLYDL